MTLGVVNELRLDLEKANGDKAYEVYQNFSLSTYPLYTLHIGNYSGTELVIVTRDCGITMSSHFQRLTKFRDHKDVQVNGMVLGGIMLVVT